MAKKKTYAKPVLTIGLTMEGNDVITTSGADADPTDVEIGWGNAWGGLWK